jgi:hypothetical protein
MHTTVQVVNRCTFRSTVPSFIKTRPFALTARGSVAIGNGVLPQPGCKANSVQGVRSHGRLATISNMIFGILGNVFAKHPNGQPPPLATHTHSSTLNKTLQNKCTTCDQT